MSRIRILSAEVRGKIAAGEVITRPASVVKELVENSLDAEAKRIEIEIGNGGKTKCLVNDDGCGMGREDAQLALERYATSKIGSVDDMELVMTYGFRGEALASIVQVSKFEIETSDGLVGTKIIAEGGLVKSILDSERPQGTRVKVSDIFFNLPPRLKFLKSANWERRLITDMINTYAVICPDVSFYLGDAGREILNMPGVGSALKRLNMLFSRELTDYLVEIDFHLGATHITGYVSRPGLALKHQLKYIYVNSRPVKYPRIFRALIDVYQDPQYLPAFAVDIKVDPKTVDANVHPTKNEVKLRDERYVIDLLCQVVKRAIYKTTMYVDSGVPDSEKDDTFASKKFVQDIILPYGEAERLGPSRATDEFWQLHDTYILAQTKSGMIMIDQHVAHERIIYESIMRGKVQSQRLLFPITLELTPEEYRIYEKTKSTLVDMGIDFKEFSNYTVVIDSLPSDVHVNREEIAGIFGELNSLGVLIKEKAEVARVVACRGAIKAGQRLSSVEMQSLIDRLFATENPYTCPHGRPIVLRWTIEELAHKFGRT
ncbi:MAG: DNA mismatch repair endonuclease MutL [candidate division WOR-3 bacterium]|nr:MAG: DNA mismatch repair endonuclease MutL [candidate division WOR-3 bacterium]